MIHPKPADFRKPGPDRHRLITQVYLSHSAWTGGFEEHTTLLHVSGDTDLCSAPPPEPSQIEVRLLLAYSSASSSLPSRTKLGWSDSFDGLPPPEPAVEGTIPFSKPVKVYIMPKPARRWPEPTQQNFLLCSLVDNKVFLLRRANEFQTFILASSCGSVLQNFILKVLGPQQLNQSTRDSITRNGSVQILELLLISPEEATQQVEWKTPPTLAPCTAILLYSATAFSVWKTRTSTPFCFTKSSVEEGTWEEPKPWGWRRSKVLRFITCSGLTCRASLMPLPMISSSTPFFSTSSRSAGWTPGWCCGSEHHENLSAALVLDLVLVDSHWSRSLSSPKPGCLQATPYSPYSWRSNLWPSCGPMTGRRSQGRTWSRSAGLKLCWWAAGVKTGSRFDRSSSPDQSLLNWCHRRYSVKKMTPKKSLTVFLQLFCRENLERRPELLFTCSRWRQI